MSLRFAAVALAGLVVLPALLTVAPMAEAAAPTASITPRGSNGFIRGEFALGEVIFLDLYVRANGETTLVYRDLRIMEITPAGTFFIGTITDGSAAIQLAPGAATTQRISWDQVPTGSGQSLPPGRYRIEYLDGTWGVAATVTLDLGFNPDLRVVSLSVSSAPPPPPLREAVAPFPSPLSKRIDACVVNTGSEWTPRTDIAFYHRGTIEDPSARHLIVETGVVFDGSYPSCPAGNGKLGARLTFDWFLPKEAANQSINADTVIAIVDHRNRIMETDEHNNGLSASFTVYDECEFTWTLCPISPPVPTPTPPNVGPTLETLVYLVGWALERVPLP